MKNTNDLPPRQFKLKILLADDDQDDRLLFREALDELELSTQLTTVFNGEGLMQLLTGNSNDIFDVLFLDLNMPRKSGFACLDEIKRNNKLKSLPVIIFSTSCDQSVIDLLLSKRALNYFSKPAEFFELKKIIKETILLITKTLQKNLQA